MPVSRMRMRQWMEMKIESKSIPGLAWVDKEKTMFTIPWKHAARHGWELDKDASLFKEWAIHTGKYVEGQTSDPKTWKANFRCAMNSLPDIEEVKDRSINKGHAAMRFFRMLPATPKSRDKQSRAKEAKSRKKIPVVKLEEDTDYSDAHSPIDESTREETLSTQENTVDSTVHSTEQQDFTTVIPCEVPDWSNAVEIGTDFSNFSYRFEVSPEHDPDFVTDEIIEICQMLERETQWITHSVDDTGLLSNEPCTSPGSQWSESSSVDELDEAPHYTTLGIEFPNPMEDLWSNFDQSIPL